ncbi:helicase associated domain-containing protein [Streptomyces sp. NPDC002671]
MIHDGDDLGTWIQRQRRDRTQLTREQQERLTKLGLTLAQQPAATAREGAGEARGRLTECLCRGARGCLSIEHVPLGC